MPDSVVSETAAEETEAAASEPVPQRALSLPEVLELEPGESYRLFVSDEAVMKSGDESVLSVTPAGLLRAEGEGETSLCVLLDGVEKAVTVRVMGFTDAEEANEEELPPGKYRLAVNKTRNYVVVYDIADEAMETPLKAMICSTGKATPENTYKLKSRKVWNRLYGGVWGKYATVITGDILFHSVPYQKKDSATLIGKYYNELGTAASMGCIRLRVCDSKWIYDCCKEGTMVTFVTDDVDCPIPYELPLTLPDELCWDPTDPEAGNPWETQMPRIEAENHALAKGSEFDPADYFRAYDSAGNDVSENAVVVCDADTSRTGIYLLHIFVRDALGRSAARTVRITVAERGI